MNIKLKLKIHWMWFRIFLSDVKIGYLTFKLKRVESKIQWLKAFNAGVV